MEEFNTGRAGDEFSISAEEAAELLADDRLGEASALALVVVHDRLSTLMPQAGRLFTSDELAAIELIYQQAREIAP